jgi:hypothetical protein
MRTYVGHQEALDDVEFEELAQGFEPLGGIEDLGAEDFRRLFLGEPGETAAQRAIRREVASEVLAELLRDSSTDSITELNARYAVQLLFTVPLWSKRGTAQVKGAAA